jgi:hypothetical protein
MSYVPRLPDPLYHKIAGWGLPTEVEIALLETIKARILSCGDPPGVMRTPLEVTIPDRNGCYYNFYGRIVAEVVGNDIVLRDCDFDPVPVSG